MGLIKALGSAVGTTLADQWKEFFYCDALEADVLMVKGVKRTSERSSNTKASDNIISAGSGIAVADGQCMLIVEQGKVVEVCAEPGQYTWDTSTEPSIFTGNLGQGILNTFMTIGKRFTYGADTGKDQRVYYINTKELIDNKFGTPNPIPFRVVDKNIGLDVDITIRCNGVYSFKISDPIIFYTNIAGNDENEYRREEIDGQLKAEFLSALQPGFAKISELGIRYSAVPAHTMELSSAMSEILTPAWSEKRGISVVSVAINSITAPKEDEDMIKELQSKATLRDPGMAAAVLAGAQAEAMKEAAGNEGGAMLGFLGLNMANAVGNASTQSLYGMAEQQKAQQEAMQAMAGNAGANGDGQKAEAMWKCPKCNTTNTGKFCANCGEPMPGIVGWTCECGTVNKGKFCTNCGKAKPEGALLYKCDKCGWEPEDPTKPPKFCPECGDPFDELDIQAGDAK